MKHIYILKRESNKQTKRQKYTHIRVKQIASFKVRKMKYDKHLVFSELMPFSFLKNLNVFHSFYKKAKAMLFNGGLAFLR